MWHRDTTQQGDTAWHRDRPQPPRGIQVAQGHDIGTDPGPRSPHPQTPGLPLSPSPCRRCWCHWGPIPVPRCRYRQVEGHPRLEVLGGVGEVDGVRGLHDVDASALHLHHVTACGAHGDGNVTWGRARAPRPPGDSPVRPQMALVVPIHTVLILTVPNPTCSCPHASLSFLSPTPRPYWPHPPMTPHVLICPQTHPCHRGL